MPTLLSKENALLAGLTASKRRLPQKSEAETSPTAFNNFRRSYSENHTNTEQGWHLPHSETETE
jgi:hypothetical protein